MIYFMLFRIVFIVNMPKVLNNFKVLLNALIMSYNFEFLSDTVAYLLAILMLLKAKTEQKTQSINQPTNQPIKSKSKHLKVLKA